MSRLGIAFCLSLTFAAHLQGQLPQTAREPLNRASAKLTSTDKIILAGVGDKVHSAHQNAMRQALRTALDESPYLNLVPDSAISVELRKMSYSPSTQLSSEVAQKICQRVAGKAYVVGFLATQTDGARFTIELQAVDCNDGETLAVEQFTAPDEETIIDALGRAATKLRADLGEPLETLKRFNTSLSQATSLSLDALHAWSSGIRTWQENGATSALPLLTNAVKLDPRFATAIYDLGLAYRNAGEEGRARDLFTRAFAQRQRASARKRFAITAQYYAFVTVDSDRAVVSFKQWIQSYPNDYKAVSNLGSFYGDVCRYKEAIAEFEQAREMNPNDFIPHDDLIEMLTATGEFDKARAAYQQMMRMGLDDDSPHLYLYVIGFLQNDPKEMAEQTAWFERKADLKHEILSEEADAAAYAGHLARARELTDQAVESALKSDNKEQAASWLLNSAWREVLFGHAKRAHDQAVRALEIAPDSREGEATAAIILARTGHLSRAQAIITDIEKRYSNHSVMQSYWLPCIKAQIALKRGDASAALKQLETAAPLDTLYPQVFFYSLMPSVVLRAEAYLLLRQPARAANEWQTVLNNPGIVQLSATAAIAKLQLARASAVQADDPSTYAKARSTYQDFFSLWKDADLDIPILRQAKAEFAKLK